MNSLPMPSIKSLFTSKSLGLVLCSIFVSVSLFAWAVSDVFLGWVFSAIAILFFLAQCLWIWVQLRKDNSIETLPIIYSSDLPRSIEFMAEFHNSTPDGISRAQAIVYEWNSTALHHNGVAVGDWVLYKRSPIEGSIKLRTKSAAYVFGGEFPVVDLECIGTVFLIVGSSSDKLRVNARRDVEHWNRHYKVGESVFYDKSAIEGRVIVKTSSKAYLKEGEPVIDIAGFGAVFLYRITPAVLFGFSQETV